ncbi:MAG: TRAP transporter TatT component family protein [Pseudomonadota bacterium]
MHLVVRVILLIAMLMPLAAGCSTRQMAVREMAGILDTGMTAFENDDDLEMLARAFPANIKLVEALLASDPANADLNVMLARLYASYAFAFLEPSLEIDYFGLDVAAFQIPADAGQDPERIRARALGCYEKGERYALAVLTGRYPGAPELLKTQDGQAAFFQKLSRRDVPALFWWAFNLGARINLERSSVALLAKAHLVETAMITVAALDPGYQNGGAHLFLLAYYGSRPPMMGGDPAVAAGHYTALVGIAGDDFWLGAVYYARYVLQPKQDRKGFAAIMDQVTRAPQTDRYRLYNAIAAVRARIYLRAMDDLFTEEDPS